jgi:uncharacterized membrane protein YhaH (DUF805 family)
MSQNQTPTSWTGPEPQTGPDLEGNQAWAGQPYQQPGLPTGAEPTLDQPYYAITPIAAVKRAFSKYARFDGRASRGEYWWWTLIIGGAFFVLSIAASVLGVSSSPDGGRTPGTAAVPLLIILGIAGLAVIVPNLALLVRRLHDAGFSGWLALLTLIPSVGGLILLVLAALPSSPAGARFDRPTGGLA